jgi:hypothetical protein
MTETNGVETVTLQQMIAVAHKFGGFDAVGFSHSGFPFTNNYPYNRGFRTGFDHHSPREP